MSFYDTLRKNLTPELFTQVTDQLGDDFDFDLVPRSRLNKVIKQRNELRDQLSEGSQPQSSSKKAPNEDDDEDFKMPQAKGKGTEVDVDALKQQWLKEQGDAVKAVRLQYAALEKLRAANAIDPELLWQAGLIDQSKLTVEADGTVKGLDEAITELTKSKGHLFSKGKSGVDSGTGKDGGDDSFASIKSKEDFLKLSTQDQMAFKQANPAAFKSFLES